MTAPGAMLSVLAEKPAQPRRDAGFATPNRYAALDSEIDAEFPELGRSESGMQRSCKPPPRNNRLCGNGFMPNGCRGAGCGSEPCAATV